MIRAETVLDASAVVLGLTAGGEAADLLARIGEGDARGHAPDLIVSEVVSALAVGVRADRRSLEDAHTLLGLFVSSPIQLHPARVLAAEALELAASSPLSAYDAFYAVLAATLDAPLVTADRRLAAAVPGSLLVA